MRVEAVSNAGFLITLPDQQTILTDPWLSDGIYYGSWYNYPPLTARQKDYYARLKPDYLYISHLHPDHMDMKTLAGYPPGTPVLIGDLPTPHLYRNLQGMGFTDIRPLPLDQQMRLDGFTVTILPEFHGTSAGYVSEIDYAMDTSLLVESGGFRLLNIVDNPIKAEDAVRVRRRFGPPDIAIVPYGGASFYPHAFPQYDNAEKIRCRDLLKQRMLSGFVDVSRILGARWTIPAAGSYVMGSRLADYSDFLHQATPGELRNIWEKSAEMPGNLVILGPGDSLDAQSGAVHVPAGPVDYTHSQRLDYARSLADRTLDHDLLRIPPGFSIPWQRMYTRARSNMWRYQTRFGVFPHHDVLLTVLPATHAGCPGTAPLKMLIPLDNEELVFTDDTQAGHRPWSRFTVDAGLMLMLLVQAANWNNAEIGALITMERWPDEQNPTVHTLMNYFFI